MRLGCAVLAALLVAAAPVWSQTYYSNGGPQPGDQGIGAPVPASPGRSPSDDGLTIGQPLTAQSPVSQAQTGQAQTGQGSGSQGVEQNAINQAVQNALQSAGQSGQTQQQGQQGQTQPGQDQAQQYSGQGGFVTDDTGLGHVSNNSGPAPSPSGPRMETVKVTQAKGGVVRWLDKVSGRTVDISLADGQSKSEGRLTIKLTQCRYPVADPSSNAYAYLIIHDSQVKKPIFHGWMIASSPALDPLDSPRYDVWLLHCTTS